MKIIVTPARHASGRGLKQKQALWASFIILTPNKKVFYSGDTGYGKHFKAVGDKYGPFDLALVECGQYDKNWKYIHMQPEQSLQAALDLPIKARYTAGKASDRWHPRTFHSG